MTKLITFALLFTLVTTAGMSQNWIATNYIEKTHVSNKVGTSVGIVFKSKVEFGVFYQEHKAGISNEKKLTKKYEKSFTGLFVNLPLNETLKYLDFYINLRTGMTNKENFFITPAFHATLKPMKILRLGVGAGIRNLKPTWQGHITFIL